LEEDAMAFMNWSDTFAVNIAEVDAQHKKLLSLLNELFDAMKVGKGREVVGKVLTDLIDYTVYHFGTEEKLFKRYNYPDYLPHKKEHDELTKKAVALKTDFDQGKQVVTIEVMNFLKDWLNVHILQVDKKFGPFLNSKGVK
jgi:hemerythrin